MADPRIPSVNLSRESKKEIVEALRDIRKAIVDEERKSQTFSENIADSLTSGSSFMESIRDAVRTESSKESAKLRRALDPLEIVKKMTGGSKLATALAGKAIGRKNEDIRRSIGMRTPEADPVIHEPSRSESLPLASSVASGEAIPLLEQIARSVSLIAIRVTDIADKMKAMKKAELDADGRLRDKVSGKFMSAQQAKEAARQAELLKEIRDSLMGIRKDESVREDQRKDAARSERAKILNKPTVQVNSKGQEIAKPASKDEGGFFSGLLGTFLKLETALAGFAIAIGSVLNPIETFKTALGFVTKGAEAIRDTVKFFTTGDKVADAVSIASKTAQGLTEGGLAAKAVTAGARIGQKILPKKEIPSVAGKVAVAESEGAAKALTKGTEKVAEAGAKAAVELPKPKPKVPTPPAKKTVTKVGKDKLQKILSTKLPKAFGGATLGKVIPGIGAALGLGFAVSRLVKGDVVGAALEAVSGFGGAVTAIPAIIGQLVRDVYQEAYGLFPEADPMRGERLPELAETVKESAANWLKGEKKSENTPNAPQTLSTASKLSTVTPETPQNTTGQALAQSTAMREELRGTSPVAKAVVPSSVNVNNITNTKSSAIFAPGLPASRSQDSSYLRALDHNLPG